MVAATDSGCAASSCVDWDVAGAVTITFNYDMVAFIPMIGLGVAVTAMVGQHMGAGDHEGARKSTMLALRVGYGYALIMMALCAARAIRAPSCLYPS